MAFRIFENIVDLDVGGGASRNSDQGRQGHVVGYHGERNLIFRSMQ